MSVLTRIKNNQILDSTIYANAKIVPGSIVGSLFNSNLTMTSDVTITGNLTVQGASTYLTVASTNTYVNDPLIVLNNAFSGTNTYDLGFVFNRGTLQNVALIWNEFNKEFRLLGTTETGTTYGNINQSNFANLQLGNLTAQYTATIRGNLDQTLTGIYGATFAGNVGLNGPYVTTGQTQISLFPDTATTINVGSASSVIKTPGWINAAGNVSASQLIAGSLTTRSAYGNIILSPFNSIFADGSSSQNIVIVQASTTGLSDGMGMFAQTSQSGVLYSTRGIVFRTGATVRNADTPTGGNNYVTMSTSADSTAYTNGALIVTGGVGISGNLNVNGDLAVNGNLTIRGNTIAIASNNLVVADSIIELHYLNDGNLTVNDGRDIGLRMHFFDTENQNAALVRSDDTGFLEWYGRNAVENSNINIGAGADYGTIKSGNLQLAGQDLTGQILSAVNSNVNVFTGNVTQAQIFTSANVSIGSSVGVTEIRNTTLRLPYATDVVVGQTSVNFANTTATTINAFGAATSLHLGSGSGTTTVRNRLLVDREVYNGSTTNGALRVVGTGAFGSNIFVGNGAVFNDLQSSERFRVRGVVSTNVFVVEPGYQAVYVNGPGNEGNLTLDTGATFSVRSSDSIRIPAGTTAERPSNTGNVDVRGMLRYSTSLGTIEWYTGSEWATPGAASTVITDQQINGDGVSNVFILSNNTTTNSTIVSINGVIQFPIAAYSITGNVLTFTEAPATGDVIDVRALTTTTTVSSLESANGFVLFDLTNATSTYANIAAGPDSPTVRIAVDTEGKVNLVNDTKIAVNGTAYNIAANNTPYTIDTYTQSRYAMAKYEVKAKRGTGAGANVEAYSATVITDGAGNAYVTTYGIINNGYIMGVLTANVLAGNVQLYYTSVSAAGVMANVKINATYIV